MPLSAGFAPQRENFQLAFPNAMLWHIAIKWRSRIRTSHGPILENLRQRFIAFSVDAGVLRFGEFITQAGVEEIRGRAAGLGDEFAKAQDAGIDREGNETLT